MHAGLLRRSRWAGWAFAGLAVALAACSGGGEASVTTAMPGVTASTTVQASSSTATPPTATPPNMPTPSEPTTTVTNNDPMAMTDPGVDATALAATFTEVERAMRNPSVPLGTLAAVGRRQQLGYRRLSGREEWQSDVLAALAPDVRSVVEVNLSARNALKTIKSPPPPATLPAWTILEPASPDQLLAWYREAEQRTGVPWTYLAAINLVETRMGRIRGDSSAGAQGPMQFLPTTWASCCRGDINDPHDAINGAADYLVSRGAPADMAKAVFGYNPSRGYVTAVQTYASVMDADVRAFYGYAAWQVFVSSTAGDVRLPVGYSATAPIDAASYLSEHPGDRAP